MRLAAKESDADLNASQGLGGDVLLYEHMLYAALKRSVEYRGEIDRASPQLGG